MQIEILEILQNILGKEPFLCLVDIDIPKNIIYFTKNTPNKIVVMVVVQL